MLVYCDLPRSSLKATITDQNLWSQDEKYSILTVDWSLHFTCFELFVELFVVELSVKSEVRAFQL